MEALPYVDALVKEYLLFRGFTRTLQTFQADLASDRGCGFQADQISNLLFDSLIPQHDCLALLELFAFLKAHLFSRLSDSLEGSASKIELSVLRLYVVQAVEAGKRDKVQEFFSALGERLADEDFQEWNSWFALPFLQKPQRDARFQVFFTKPWKELVEASFRNFMAEAVQQLPLPVILRFNTDRRRRQGLERKVEALEAELTRLQAKNEAPMIRNASSELGHKSGAAEQLESWALTGLLDSEYVPMPSRQGEAGASLRIATPDTSSSPGFQGGVQLQIDEPQRSGRRKDSGLESGSGTADRESRSAPKSAQPLILRVGRGAQGALEVGSSSREPVIGAHASGGILSDISDSEMQNNHLLSLQQSSESAVDLGDSLRQPSDQAPAGSEEQPVRSEEQPGVGSHMTEEDDAGKSSPAAQHGLNGGRQGGMLRRRSVAGKVEILKGHDAAVSDIALSPDGRNIASASGDGVVRIWAPESLDGNSERSAVLLCGAPVHRLAWDMRADKIMLVGTEGKGVKAWHLDTKRMVAHMRPDAAFPNICDVTCSPGEPSFLCACASGKEHSSSGRLTLWNLRAFRKMHTFRGEGRMTSVCFSPDGCSIAAGGDDGSVRLFDTNTAVPTASLPLDQFKGEASFVRFLGPDGSSLLTLNIKGRLQAWDVAMLRGPTWECDLSASCQAQGPASLMRFSATADGKAAAIACGMNTTPILRLFAEGGEVHRGAVHGGAVSAVAWHPAKQIVVGGSSDRTLSVTHLLDF